MKKNKEKYNYTPEFQEKVDTTGWPKHRGRPMTWEEKQNCRISRRHTCPVCGRVHYIGRDEERNAWECITETSQGFYIAQCGHCGGLITITARGEEANKR